MNDKIELRKGDHIRLAGEDAVEAPGSAMGAFEEVELIYQAFPEVDRDEIGTSLVFLGKKLSLPFLIGSMTGGTEEAHQINLRLL